MFLSDLNLQKIIVYPKIFIRKVSGDYQRLAYIINDY